MSLFSTSPFVGEVGETAGFDVWGATCQQTLAPSDFSSR